MSMTDTAASRTKDADAGAGKIDVHFHLIPDFYREAVYAAGKGPAIGRYPDWSPALALDIMDRHGIAVALTSVAQPGVQFLDKPAALKLARQCNDYAADLNQQWPQRFGAFGLVPMHDIEAALAEARYCLEELKFEGICLFASYGEKFLGDPFYEPLLAYLDTRRAPVFIHPVLHPTSLTLDLPWPGFMVEYVFDTTRAAVNLLFSGTLERLPHIPFILPHAGGTLPYLAWRLSVSPMIDKRLRPMSRDEVMQGLAHFWYDDALSCGPAAMGALKAVAAPERIVFGSDWPFANESVVAEEIKDFVSPDLLTDAERRRIARDNALALFPGRA